MSKKRPAELDERTIRILAAHSELDPRTVRRASREGVEALRAEVDRQRLREAAEKLRVKLP